MSIVNRETPTFLRGQLQPVDQLGRAIPRFLPTEKDRPESFDVRRILRPFLKPHRFPACFRKGSRPGRATFRIACVCYPLRSLGKQGVFGRVIPRSATTRYGRRVFRRFADFDQFHLRSLSVSIN